MFKNKKKNLKNLKNIIEQLQSQIEAIPEKKIV